MELSPAHLLFLLVLFGAIFTGIVWFAYRHGRKVGDQTGYIRGDKEGRLPK